MERGLGVAASLVCRSASMRTWKAYSGVWRRWEELLHSLGGWAAGSDLEGAVLYFISVSFGDNVSFSGLSTHGGSGILVQGERFTGCDKIIFGSSGLEGF